MTSKFAWGDMAQVRGTAHNLGMAPRSRRDFKPQRRRTFIRAWRKHRNDMSQEKLVERLQVETGYSISVGQLSRIESGKQEYKQDFLEAVAMVLGCAPEDLIMRDPTGPTPRWSILDGLTDRQIRRVARIAEAVRDEDEDEEPQREAG